MSVLRINGLFATDRQLAHDAEKILGGERVKVERHKSGGLPTLEIEGSILVGATEIRSFLDSRKTAGVRLNLAPPTVAEASP